MSVLADLAAPSGRIFARTRYPVGAALFWADYLFAGGGQFDFARPTLPSQKLKVLGRGVHGLVLEDGDRVIKVTTSELDRIFAVNEVLVLRALQPLGLANFMTMHEVYQHALPRDGGRSHAVVHPEPRGNFVHLVLPRLVGAQTLKQWAALPSTSATELVQVLTQVVLGLEMAFRAVEFSHNDLHAQNILVEPLPAPKRFSYRFDGKTLGVVSSWRAVIIDFGHSACRGSLHTHVNHRQDLVHPIARVMLEPRWRRLGRSLLVPLVGVDHSRFLTGDAFRAWVEQDHCALAEGPADGVGVVEAWAKIA